MILTEEQVAPEGLPADLKRLLDNYRAIKRDIAAFEEEHARVIEAHKTLLEDRDQLETQLKDKVRETCAVQNQTVQVAQDLPIYVQWAWAPQEVKVDEFKKRFPSLAPRVVQEVVLVSDARALVDEGHLTPTDLDAVLTSRKPATPRVYFQKPAPWEGKKR